MLDEILPDIIDARMYNYLKVDNQYIVTFIIYGYPKEIDSFNFLSYFPIDIEINISVHLAKQNSMDVIRKVTSSISINETEYGDSSKSNQSRDILNKLKEDAKQLRYEMQINNQEIYNVYTFVKIKSDNEKKMLDILMYLKNSLITKMLKVNTLNFRHLVGYIATLPFANYQKKYLSNYFVNMTTNNLKILFPFYTKTIMHENGILFGKVKNDNK